MFNEVTPHIPFKEWENMIFPHYKKKSIDGCPKKEFGIVLRAFLARMFLGLSFEQLEDKLHECETTRDFCGISDDSFIPSDSSIFRFEQLLTENGFQKKMFKEHVDGLIIGGKIIKVGTCVDTTIIDAPTSKRNKEKARDPEAGWTKKAGNHRHGFKGGTGVDENSGLIHSVTFTAANEHDLKNVDDLLHGDEENVNGDSAFLNIEEHSEKAKKIKNKNIAKRRSSYLENNSLSPLQKLKQVILARHYASIRAKVEHPYSTIKRIFKFRYTRTRGIKKNEARFTFLCLLANIYKLGRPPKPKRPLQGSSLPIRGNDLKIA
jgi:IS5 family transposase